MDQATLVDLAAAQEAGASFLVRVFAEEIPVTDAFWSYAEADGEWMLTIATPWRDEKGLRFTASALRSSLDKMSSQMRGGLGLSEISIVSPTTREVLDLRRKYGTVSNGRGQRLSRINSSQTEPIIYFLNHAVPGTEGSTING